MHARDYMTYAYLQMGMDAQAKTNLEHAMRLGTMTGGAQGAAGAGPNTFAMAAIPARFAMERQQWAEAMALTPNPAPTAPYTEAITHFARAIGAARAGKPDAAAADIARLAAIRDREIEMKDEYWAQQVDIQRRGAEAWVMFAKGDKAGAITAMSETAGLEDATDKSAVTPGPLAPAREMLGYMLLENNQPKDALAEFEAVMKKEPNRFLAHLWRRQGGRSLEAGGQGQGLFQAARRHGQGRRHGASRAAVRARQRAVTRTGRRAPGRPGARLAATRSARGPRRRASTRRRGPTSNGRWKSSAARHRTRRSGTRAH